MQSLLLWQFTYRLKPAFSSQLWIAFLIFPSSQKALYLFHIENGKHLGGNKSCGKFEIFFLFLDPTGLHWHQKTILKVF